MSTETLDLMLTLDQGELDTQIALQCAPLLTRLKISNLLTVEKSHRTAAMRLFRGTSLSPYLLCDSGDKVTFLLYDRKRLPAYLAREDVRRLMERFGYSRLDLGVILRQVAERYRAHMHHKTGFPHEIGLLLGYPPADVTGFIENSGKNSLYIGYWKVYSDVARCQRVFAGYDQAREKVIRMISRGMDVRNIVKNQEEAEHE